MASAWQMESVQRPPSLLLNLIRRPPHHMLDFRGLRPQRLLSFILFWRNTLASASHLARGSLADRFWTPSLARSYLRTRRTSTRTGRSSNLWTSSEIGMLFEKPSQLLWQVRLSVEDWHRKRLSGSS